MTEIIIEGKLMKSKRQSTVEPVFETLINFMGMRKINTIGIKQANKALLMSVMAYNLKKFINYTTTLTEAVTSKLNHSILLIYCLIRRFLSCFELANNLKPSFYLLENVLKKELI